MNSDTSPTAPPCEHQAIGVCMRCAWERAYADGRANGSPPVQRIQLGAADSVRTVTFEVPDGVDAYEVPKNRHERRARNARDRRKRRRRR